MILKKLNSIEYRKINALALPLILNNVTAMIIGLCDDAMAGRISVGAFAAIGMIVSTINSITGVVGAAAVAFNIIGGRCNGEKDTDGLHDNLLFNIVYSIVVGLLFFVITVLTGKFLLKTIYHFNGKLLNQAWEYMSIFSISIGLNMLLFTFSSYFKIVKKTKYIFCGNLSASILNVIFDYALIFGHFGMPKLGMKGNAIGSILAMIINLIVYIIASKAHKFIFIRKIDFYEIFKNSAGIIIPLMGQELLESTVMVVAMNYMLSSIGVLPVSVYNLLTSVISIALMPMYAYSQTSLTIISEKTGAKDQAGIKRTPGRCLLMALVFYAGISVIMLILKNYIPGIITDDKKLILAASSFLPTMVLINVMNIPNNVYKYSLQAVGAEKWVFMASLFINGFSIIVIFVFTVILHMELWGIFAGTFINYLILTLVFLQRYRKLEFVVK
ncbi:MATE family efflux transporter [Clostridium oryzae]|uniref:Probable multidrug resistance protein NorM n=1 Tax=Clostridium oryzae TaxID=1450648 RepID=A0A1V4IYC1_9CLOT|nr:MATE family efflux transporter [Clostridium oryzae]OPJ64893.1 multidrug resistance protein MdtK [Clostridium oryzae]